MNKKILITIAFFSIIAIYLSSLLYAVPNNGSLKLSPTGTVCINEVKKLTGTWDVEAGDWKAVSATLVYQNTRDQNDKGDVSNNGSGGKLTLPLGETAGHYDVSLTVDYKCGDETITVNEIGELCVVDVGYISGEPDKAICVGESVELHAEPVPNACSFPDGQPEWEMSKKENGTFGNWKAHSSGEENVTVKFEKFGTYKLRVRCGTKGDWVESEEMVAVSVLKIDGPCCIKKGEGDNSFTITTKPAGHAKLFKITPKASGKNTLPYFNKPVFQALIPLNFILYLFDHFFFRKFNF